MTRRGMGDKKHHAGHFQGWHDGHNLVAVPKVGGVGIGVVCLDCHVWTDLEAASEPLTVAETKARKVKP